MRWLSGWAAVIVLAGLAAAAEGFGRNPWIRKIGWTVAALVALHAAVQAWRE